MNTRLVFIVINAIPQLLNIFGYITHIRFRVLLVDYQQSVLEKVIPKYQLEFVLNFIGGLSYILLSKADYWKHLLSDYFIN